MAKKRGLLGKVSPHTVRHGGASHDAFHGIRSIEQIQARGQRRCPSSCIRYWKPGRMLLDRSIVFPAVWEEASKARTVAFYKDPWMPLKQEHLGPQYGRWVWISYFFCLLNSVLQTSFHWPVPMVSFNSAVMDARGQLQLCWHRCLCSASTPLSQMPLLRLFQLAEMPLFKLLQLTWMPSAVLTFFAPLTMCTNHL